MPVVPQDRGAPTRSALLSDTARAEGLTIRQLYQRIAGGRGHYQVVGSPKDVVDLMEEWFTTGAADGFNVLPPFFPELARRVRRAGGAGTAAARALSHRL